MFRNGCWLLVTLLSILFVFPIALADVPGLISYQGILKDTDGEPITTPVSAVFTIYDDPAASDPANIKWQETHSVTPDDNGLFMALLGAGSPAVPITNEVFEGPDRWLGVRVEGESEMTPRTRVVSFAYSQRVGTVDGASGGVISGDVSIASDLSISGNLNATGKATIGAGHTNTGTAAFVAGENNTALGAYGTVGGGMNNITGGDYGFVGSGLSNSASGLQSVVGGGYANQASGESNFIGSGWHNYTAEYQSTVSGGMQDTASASYSTVGGGYLNAAHAWGSTISGGQLNRADGQHSVVPGGYANQALGNFSLAAGYNAVANHAGTFVWSDATGGFSSTADNQFLIKASGGVGIGTNNPTSALHVNGEAKCEVGGVQFFMVPRGAIIMWSGSLASIPSGWALCDGGNGTPDLRNRFIFGVNTGEDPGATGGSATIPPHSHTVDIASFNSSTPSHSWLGAGGFPNSMCPDYDHYHSIDPPATATTIAGAASSLPPYYKLAFIMKL